MPSTNRTPPFQHLEKKYFEVGNLGFRVWRFMDTITGMLICNDRRWPEAFRVLALQGAEIVALGFNTPSRNALGGRRGPEACACSTTSSRMQAGCLPERNCWAVGRRARAGTEERRRARWRGACIVAPSGKVVARADGAGDELVVYRCDLDAGQSYKRTTFNFAIHRQPDQYRMIVERKGAMDPS